MKYKLLQFAQLVLRASQISLNLQALTCFHFAAISVTTFPSQRAIQEDLVINKQDLVKDKLFHLNEPFQLINSRKQS